MKKLIKIKGNYINPETVTHITTEYTFDGSRESFNTTIHFIGGSNIAVNLKQDTVCAALLGKEIKETEAEVKEDLTTKVNSVLEDL